MRVLVIGSLGYIGGFVVQQIRAAGHDVRGAARCASAATDTIHLDLAELSSIGDWAQVLGDVDAIVNCAGILRESGASTFESVHVDAIRQLIDRCTEFGVSRWIQISAVGDDADEFIASKHRGDEILMQSRLQWTILRPSIVYSPRGAYGGTSLLRAMAALPAILFLPGDGQQLLQPVTAEDVGRAVAAALDRPQSMNEVIELVGPEVVTTRSYLERTRKWLGCDQPIALKLPLFAVGLAAKIADTTTRGPLGMTMFRQLSQGNTGNGDAVSRLNSLLGITPESMNLALTGSPSQAADRFHARAYFVPSLVRWTLALIWILSGIVGLLTPAPISIGFISPSGLDPSLIPGLVMTLSILDIVVGLLILLPGFSTLAAWVMLAMVIGYTAFVSLFVPSLWMDPPGGVLKNIAIIVLLAVYLLLGERRR